MLGQEKTTAYAHTNKQRVQIARLFRLYLACERNKEHCILDTPEKQQQRVSFLDLQPEIRSHIYSYAMPRDRHVYHSYGNGKARFDKCQKYESEGEGSVRLGLKLIQIC